MSILLEPSRACQRCARSALRFQGAAGPSRLRPFSSTGQWLDTSSTSNGDRDESFDKPKINTWFLNRSSTPSSSSPAEKTSDATHLRRPTFTPYDPSSTTTTSSQHLLAAPLPASAPPYLQKLHNYLTSPSSESTEVILPHTILFLDTRSYSRELQERGEGEMIESEGGTGGNWEWVVVGQVKGRGRGVVARADGMIRRWLLQNPLSSEIPKITTSNPKTPRIDPDSDWSVIPVKGTRVCINLLTEEGRERWRLEEMWSVKSGQVKE
ncbi:hypothetical protein IAR55_000837 [Kwoniella newhampshirensis]|uniref:Uncharacterized protein n=1 Tax=Kwoniella newhampshirensis TaxID=1651941 RepID=A0AAW0Z423_9TREE